MRDPSQELHGGVLCQDRQTRAGRTSGREHKAGMGARVCGGPLRHTVKGVTGNITGEQW